MFDNPDANIIETNLIVVHKAHKVNKYVQMYTNAAYLNVQNERALDLYPT